MSFNSLYSSIHLASVKSYSKEARIIKRQEETCKKIKKKKLKNANLSVPLLIRIFSEKWCTSRLFDFISFKIFTRRNSLINLYILLIRTNLKILLKFVPSSIKSKGIILIKSIKNQLLI